MAARPAQAATAAAAAAEGDLRQCIYETEWQVSQAAGAAPKRSVRSGRHSAHHELVWMPGVPAAAAQKASLLQTCAASPAAAAPVMTAKEKAQAAAAAQAALRQARALQQIMSTPGALPGKPSTLHAKLGFSFLGPIAKAVTCIE